MKKKIYSLISVYNKSNIEKICEIFQKNKIEILATNSTAKHIKKLGYQCQNISKFTKFNETLNGRVKTLHPLIHASLLFQRNNKDHLKQFKKLNFPEINFVIINLYPFEESIFKKLNKNKLVDMIDIGGPTILKSAAKNYSSITAISNIADYDNFIKNMQQNRGKTSLLFRKKMAGKVFSLTSHYDNVISNWINKNDNININNNNKNILRYGENPHQKSFFYKNNFKKTIFDNILLQGKKLGFNNILDIDSAYECLCEFSMPTCVIIKHNIPCGVASSTNIKTAFLKAYNADFVSAFGGIVALNRKINEKFAKQLSLKSFEVIIAPSFSIRSLNIFKNKKKLILIKTSQLIEKEKFEIRSVHGGFLLQEKNLINFSKKNMNLVSNKKATKKQIYDLVFAFKVAKYVKSNAIVLVKDLQTIGIGSGQASRIDATKNALLKIKDKYKKKNFVAASDAFLPFIDNLELLIKNNCKSLVQPKGSVNDYKTIKFANLKKISLYFSKYRFFKH